MNDVFRRFPMTLDMRRRLVAGPRPHRPAADREASPQPDAVGGRAASQPLPPPVPPTLDIVIPVYNEERDLEPSVRRLLRSQRHVDLPGPASRAGFTVGLTAQVRSFATIGVLSTLAYVALYSVLRSFASPVVANAMALLTTAVGNTAANRRLTFGVRERASLLRDHAAGLTAFGLALAITTGAVSLLQAFAPGADRAIELAVLLVANVLATVARFVLLRAWILPVRPAAYPSTTDQHLQGTPS